MRSVTAGFFVAIVATCSVAHARLATLSPEPVPGYPPLQGEDILKHLYKLDPAIAEEFKRQKADLEEQWAEVSRMAAKLKSERDRIRKEYPLPRAADEAVPEGRVAPPNHTVALGESLLSIARSYDMTVDELYSVNVDLIDSQGVKPNMVLALPRVGKRTSMVPEESLQVCKGSLAETELKVSLCHRDLDVTTKERDTYKGICKVNEQIEDDKRDSQESVVQMQKMIEELKAAKSC